MKPEILQPHIEEFIKNLSIYNIPINYDNLDIRDKEQAMDPVVGKFLNFVLNIKEPSIVLEIGCGVGVSTKYLISISSIKRYIAIDANKRRLDICKNTIKNKNIEFYNANGINYLKTTKLSFDAIIIDSVKSDYSLMWHLAKKKIERGGLIIFDDVLLYGLISQNKSIIPRRYLNMCEQLIELIREVSCDSNYGFSIIPVGGGVLLARNVS
ncbi:MAG: methyltransferase domain-containing protein [Deferribacterota bacterium]|nr:methyltransferase domain-containing protein [Deferribacterota bacterium]